MPNALQLLRDDHKRVKDLFKKFEDAENAGTKGKVVGQTLTELEIHAELEEVIFYPAVREEAATKEDQMDEAEEEHHIVKLLIAELRQMQPSAAHYGAKFTVLAENVKHHIDEEESEMFPKAAELGSERLNELGVEMQARKLQLTRAQRSVARTASKRRLTVRSKTTSTPIRRAAAKPRRVAATTAKRKTSRVV